MVSLLIGGKLGLIKKIVRITNRKLNNMPYALAQVAWKKCAQMHACVCVFVQNMLVVHVNCENYAKNNPNEWAYAYAHVHIIQTKT